MWHVLSTTSNDRNKDDVFMLELQCVSECVCVRVCVCACSHSWQDWNQFDWIEWHPINAHHHHQHRNSSIIIIIIIIIIIASTAEPTCNAIPRKANDEIVMTMMMMTMMMTLMMPTSQCSQSEDSNVAHLIIITQRGCDTGWARGGSRQHTRKYRTFGPAGQNSAVGHFLLCWYIMFWCG